MDISFWILVVAASLLLPCSNLIAQVSETTSYLVVNTFSCTADGISQFQVRVTLKDASGNPVPGQSVSINSSHGLLITITAPETTNPNGQCTGTYATGYAGEGIITAKAGTKTISRGIYGQNLAGGWLFDEASGDTAYDLSSNANNGTLYGSSGKPAWNSEGKFGECLSFNGTDSQYVKVLNNSSLTGFSHATWMMWVYPTNLFLEIIMSLSGCGYRYIVHLPTRGLIFQCWTTDEFVYALEFHQGPLINTWYHLAVTYDKDGGVDNMKSYLNGELVTLRTVTGAVIASATDLYIGSDGPSLRYFTGNIDEVFIYNRVLTASEIKASYASSAKIKFSADRLKVASFFHQVRMNRPSAAITVEAKGILGGRDTSNSGNISLTSSSSTGKFSPSPLPGYDLSCPANIYLNNGSATFYYKDSTIVTHTITVSGLGLDTDSISIAVLEIPSSKKEPSIFSPNNDGINDEVTIFFNNDSHEEVKGKIFDLYGFLIRDNLSPEPDYYSLKWDGRNEHNQIVKPGVYIYQVSVGNKIVNGTIAVAR